MKVALGGPFDRDIWLLLIPFFQRFEVGETTRYQNENAWFAVIVPLVYTMGLSPVKVLSNFRKTNIKRILGCKGFFKRSICNRRVYRCSRDKQCMMSRKQRNRCQYCRLRKCLEMGMNRKGKLLSLKVPRKSENAGIRPLLTKILAIREDGMPGGRNKSIGPVTLNEGEIERVLNGVEFEQERRKLNFTMVFNHQFTRLFQD